MKEAKHILGDDFEVVSLQAIGCTEELPETDTTFEGNSFQKASYVFEKYHIPCFADDSGLEVNALNGAPGVYSARYAGESKNDEANIALLLSSLKGIKDRKARFRTVITWIDSHGIKVFDGTVKGSILEQKRGESGFGYDPVFVPDGHTRSFAEMAPAEKNSLSHRGIAIQKLATFLKKESVERPNR